MVLGFLPSVAYLLAIKLGNPAWIAPEKFAALAAATDGHGLPELAVIRTLGNGFIMGYSRDTCKNAPQNPKNPIAS